MPDKGQSKYPSMKDIVINTKGVFKLLKDLNPHKATGPDCIPSFILKSAADELAPILTQLYQYSLAEGEISSDWRDAHIGIVVTSWVSQECLLLNSCCLSVRMLYRSK
jgi:hypothetical protein